MRHSIAARFGLIVFLGCALLGGVLGGASVWQSYQNARSAAEASLVAAATARTDAIQAYLERIESELRAVSNSARPAVFVRRLEEAWAMMGDDAAQSLRSTFIDTNPYPTGARANYFDPEDGEQYSRLHSGGDHRFYYGLIQEWGFYDAFYIGLDGDILYTVIKEDDFATNLVEGRYADTGLGRAAREALAAPRGIVVFEDFSPYAPSANRAASFFAVPVDDNEGRRIGVLAVQVSIDGLSRVVNSRTGLGETDEAYAVGPDGLFRSVVESEAGFGVLDRALDDETTNIMFRDRVGVIDMTDTRGRSVIAGYAVVEFKDVRWAVVVTETPQIAYAAARQLAVQQAILAVVLTAAIGVLAMFAAVIAARPLQAIAASTRSLARGNLGTDVPHQDESTEIGDLARAIEQLKNDSIIKLDLEKTKAESEARHAIEADRAKSAFIANVSHEIRTPLNGVVATIGLLELSRLSPDQRSLLGTLRLSAKTLNGLINDILDSSKIEAGQMHLEPKLCNPAELCENVAALHGPNARERGVEVLVWTDPSLPEVMELDAGRVEQIIGNLLSNAIKFTQGVSDRTPRIILHAYGSRNGDEPRVLIDVADNGRGISEDGLKTLFDRFKQVERDDWKVKGGAGLGLAISQQLANLMGGEITVKSQQDRGSTFSLNLSAHDCVIPDLPSDRLRGLEVILTCRDHAQSVFMREILRNAGADVAIARDLSTLQNRLNDVAQPETTVVVVDDDWQDRDHCEAMLSQLGGLYMRGTQMVITRFHYSETECAVEIPNTHVLRNFPFSGRALVSAVAALAGRGDETGTGGPVQVAAVEPVEPPTLEQAEAEGRLILLVEDNAINRVLMARQLAVLGYAVRTAGDGKAAMELFDQHEFGLVMTDLHMPRMGGLALAGAIRHHPDAARRNVPVLIVTAAVLKNQYESFAAAGVNGHLIKPLELPAMQAALARWMPEPRSRPASGNGHAADGSAPPSTEVGENGIDSGKLQSLIGDDPEIRAELIREFVATTTEQLERLSSAIEEQNAGERAAIAHRLASSSQAFGAVELAELIACVEMHPPDPAGESLPALMREIETVFERVKSYYLAETV